ncbi:MAG: hypothetical protein QXH91_09745 [Candidatus Bathyarchaeia archaeon]
MKIKVEAVGKYGVKVGDEWMSVKNQNVLSQLKKGNEYEVEIATSQSGKKYITGLLPESIATPSNSDDRSNQIKRQGIFQAVLQSPILGTWASDPDEYLRLVLKFADEGVKFVDGEK